MAGALAAIPHRDLGLQPAHPMHVLAWSLGSVSHCVGAGNQTTPQMLGMQMAVAGDCTQLQLAGDVLVFVGQFRSQARRIRCGCTSFGGCHNLLHMDTVHAH